MWDLEQKDVVQSGEHGGSVRFRGLGFRVLHTIARCQFGELFNFLYGSYRGTYS